MIVVDALAWKLESCALYTKFVLQMPPNGFDSKCVPRCAMCTA